MASNLFIQSFFLQKFIKFFLFTFDAHYCTLNMAISLIFVGQKWAATTNCAPLVFSQIQWNEFWIQCVSRSVHWYLKAKSLNSEIKTRETLLQKKKITRRKKKEIKFGRMKLLYNILTCDEQSHVGLGVIHKQGEWKSPIFLSQISMHFWICFLAIIQTGMQFMEMNRRNH